MKENLPWRQSLVYEVKGTYSFFLQTRGKMPTLQNLSKAIADNTSHVEELLMVDPLVRIL